MKPVYLDFEFNNTSKRYVNLVAGVFIVDGQEYKWWLHHDRQEHHKLIEWIKSLGEVYFVSFGVVAEARSFISLGINPYNYKWVDLWCEWKQLRNHNKKYEYGTYFVMGEKRCSVPPHPNPAMNKGKDTKFLDGSLSSCVARLLEINIDVGYKQKMREKILKNYPKYNKEDREAILEYCAEDVRVLPKLFKTIVATLKKELPHLSDKELQEAILRRGRTSVSMAFCETTGIPIDIEGMLRIKDNVENAQRETILNLQKIYPFFVEENGRFVEKAYQFDNFVKSVGLEREWPKTKTGFSREESVLKHYAYLPAIAAYKEAKSHLNSLRWFRLEAWNDLSEHIDGAESRLRVWFAHYGTQSGRNAPPARVFLPAMSSWTRGLIMPGEGEYFAGSDWSSQEFAIAAYLSKDKNMIDAYLSGDPYIYFASLSRAIPWDADRKWVKDPSQAPENLQETYKKWKSVRDLFKSTVLGIQYGMGALSLAAKLGEDTGRKVSEAEAKSLIEAFSKAFPGFIRFRDNVLATYAMRPLVLPGGWAMFKDNDSALSVQNFPIQGMGAVLMQETLYLAHKRGLDVSFPLHDAVYVVGPEGDTLIKELEECMDEATETFFPGAKIRHESVLVKPFERWIDGKTAKKWDMFKKYVEPDASEQPEQLSLL